LSLGYLPTLLTPAFFIYFFFLLSPTDLSFCFLFLISRSAFLSAFSFSYPYNEKPMLLVDIHGLFTSNLCLLLSTFRKGGRGTSFGYKKDQ
jgi:hypothetical protein